MNPDQEMRYILSSTRISDCKPASSAEPLLPIPRIARLMALAIRFEGLVGEGTVQDYAELARLGGVTRARMTQIMKLLQLAPDLQEQVLFLTERQRLNERKLRAIVQQLDWSKQRRMFQKIMRP